jgi:AraC family transcriptional regulator
MRGGLASWQIAKVTTYLEANIGVSIQIADLAQAVRVSPSHFCHAFKESFGISPHAYLMRRRVERAQGLMLATHAPLSQIAADCGLTDQAHFTRMFRRFVGESPGAWRRARVPALARASKDNCRS